MSLCVCVCVCLLSPLHKQEVTGGQFSKWNLTSLNSEFSFS